MADKAAKPAKPAKLTEALIDEFFVENQKLKEAQALLKPSADKVKSLFEQIETAFRACEKDKRKVGRFMLSLTKKKGSVGWKDELVKRLSSEELKAIEDAVPEKTVVEIKEV